MKPIHPVLPRELNSVHSEGLLMQPFAYRAKEWADGSLTALIPRAHSLVTSNKKEDGGGGQTNQYLWHILESRKYFKFCHNL